MATRNTITLTKEQKKLWHRIIYFIAWWEFYCSFAWWVMKIYWWYLQQEIKWRGNSRARKRFIGVKWCSFDLYSLALYLHYDDPFDGHLTIMAVESMNFGLIDCLGILSPLEYGFRVELKSNLQAIIVFKWGRHMTSFFIYWVNFFVGLIWWCEILRICSCKLIGEARNKKRGNYLTKMILSRVRRD